MRRRWILLFILAAILLLLFPVGIYGTETNSSDKQSAWVNFALTKDFLTQDKESFFIRGQFGSMKVPADAVTILNGWNRSLKSSAAKDLEFKVEKVNKDTEDKTHVRLQQYYKGIPIYGKEVTLHAESNGNVYALNGNLAEMLNIDTIPAISENKAIGLSKESFQSLLSSYESNKEKNKIITEKLNSLTVQTTNSSVYGSKDFKVIGPDLSPKETAGLIIYNFEGKDYLAYEVDLNYSIPAPFSWKVFINAKTGAIINKYNNITDFSKATGYGYGFYNDKKTLKLIKDGGIYELIEKTDASSDFAHDVILTIDYEILVDFPDYDPFYPDQDGVYDKDYQSVGVDAHYYADQVYNYYKTKFKRNSWDGKGAPIPILTFVPMSNAYWSSSAEAFYFGIGDDNEAPYSSGLDVVAHEFTHAVTESEVGNGGFIYQNQSGALSESYSDVFASLIDPDWQIGEDVVTLDQPGDAARDMSNPGLYGQPAHMRDYVNTIADNGGVHVNSGIPNKAFYNIASAIGRDNAGKIYYQSLQYLNSNASFVDAKNALLYAAIDLFGYKSKEYNAVASGWAAVGVYSPYELQLDVSIINMAQGDSTEKIKVYIVSDSGSKDEINASEVVWSTSNPKVATVSQGVITAAGKGNAVITATKDKLSASVTVNVTPVVNQLLLDKTSVNLVAGSSNVTVKATALYSDGTKQDVTKLAVWTSGNPDIASILSPGVIKGVGKGNVSIIISYGGKSLELPAVVTLAVKSFVLSEASYDLITGNQVALQPIAVYNDNSSENVAAYTTWTSSNTKVAVVSSNGTVTAMSKGKATITGKFNNKSIKANIVVTPPVTSIAADKSAVALTVGGNKVSLKVTAYYNDGSKADVTKSVRWEVASSGNGIVSVNQGSLTGVTRGETTLTVRYQDQSIQVPVTVTPKVSKLTSDYTAFDLTIGKDAGEVSLTATYNDGSQEEVTSKANWKSSKTSVATVMGGVITPVGKGTATISGEFNGKSVSIKVTVTPPVTSIAADKSAVALTVGGSKVSLKVTAYYNDGSKADVTKSVRWEVASSGSEIVSVNQGSLTGLTRGETTLTVRYQDQSIQVPVIVTPKVSKLTSDYTAFDLTIGRDAGEVSLTATYNDGSQEEVTSKANWKSSKTSVATVMGGVITPVGKGTATISGEFNGKSVSIKVTVTPPVTSIAADKSAVALTVGGSKVSLKVTAYYNDGSKADVTKSVRWEVASSGSGIVSVNQGSLTGVTRGETMLTVRYQDQNIQIPVTVTPKVSTLTTDITMLDLTAGGPTANLTVTAHYNDGSQEEVTTKAVWKSSKGTVATVVNGIITPVAKGSTTISAEFNGKMVSVKVTVTSPVNMVAFDKSELNLEIGRSGKLALKVYYSDSSSTTLTSADSVVWSSSNPGIVSVDGGNLKALSYGDAIVSASYKGHIAEGFIRIRATLKNITGVNNYIMEQGGEGTIAEVIAIYTDGTLEAVTDACSFTSSNTRVVTVNEQGLMNPVGIGMAKIYAKYGNNSMTIYVTVIEPDNPTEPENPEEPEQPAEDQNGYAIVTGFTTVSGNNALKLLMEDSTKQTIVYEDADIVSYVYGSEDSRGLQKGDFIKYKLNSDGEIEKIDILAGAGLRSKLNGSDLDEDIAGLDIEEIANAVVNEMSSNSIKVIDMEGTEKRYVINSETKFFEIFDRDKIRQVSGARINTTVVIIDTDDDGRGADFVVAVDDKAQF